MFIDQADNKTPGAPAERSVPSRTKGPNRKICQKNKKSWVCITGPLSGGGHSSL